MKLKNCIVLAFVPMMTCLMAQADIAQPAPKTVTVDLNQTEIQEVIEIYNRLDVRATPRGPCYASSVEVSTLSREMGPSRWTVKYNGENEAALSGPEMQAMIEIFHRAGVRGTSDGVTYREKAALSESSCGMSPSHWTISFQVE